MTADLSAAVRGGVLTWDVAEACVPVADAPPSSCCATTSTLAHLKIRSTHSAPEGKKTGREGGIQGR